MPQIPVLFLKARDRRDTDTPDMFGGTHLETRTRRDGVVQQYHVAAPAPAKTPRKSERSPVIEEIARREKVPYDKAREIYMDRARQALGGGKEPTASAHAEGDKWVMPLKDAIEEHKDLVQAVATPTKADDKAEVAEQKGELKRMEEEEGAQGLDVVFDEALLQHARSDLRGAPALIASDMEADAQGIIPGKPRNLDRSIAQGRYSEQDVADAWSATRDLLRRRHGDVVTLYRADAPKDKHNAGTLTVYMADKATAQHYAVNGRKLESFQVPVEDVLAVFAKPSGYFEAIVRKPGRVAAKTAPTEADKVNPRKKYYVTMLRSGKDRPAFLAGPFDKHEDALAHVDRARDEANKVDPRSHWDAFGTSGLEADQHPPGVLNERLGLPGRTMAKAILFTRPPTA